jgi:ABC-2 type transport system permease protein
MSAGGANRTLAVARREYLQRVRSRAFMVATFLGPLILGGMMLIPALAAGRATRPLKVAVLDTAGTLRAPVERALAATTVGGAPRFLVQPPPEGPFEQARARATDAVLKGELDGYLYLPQGALDASRAEYHGRSVSAVMEMRLLERALGDAFVELRLTGAGLDPSRLKEVMRDVDLRTMRLSASGAREDRGAGFLFSFLLVFAIYTAVFMWGQALMTSVIEEKTNRVVEVMVSSVSPDTLLGGKLLGVGAAGLTQMLAWALAMGAIGLYVGSGAVAGGAAVPEVGMGTLAAFVVFFLLGFFLYGALYAAVGAAVNSMQEAQNFMLPLMAPVIMAMMFIPMVVRSPDSPLAVTLSLIPLLSPLLMFLRISVLTPPLWQVALSVVLTALTIWGVIWLAARIYRVGILMYGKRPTFPEIVRWVRAAS